MPERILSVFKRLLPFHFIFICLLVLSWVPCIITEQNGKVKTPKIETNLKNMMETWRLSDMSSQHFQLFQEILQIMEKGNMFKTSGNKSACFQVEKIIREITTRESFPRKIGIHFYFEEKEIHSDSTATRDGNINSDQFLYANRNLKTADCYKSPSLPDIHGLDRLSRKQGEINQESSNGSSSNNNLTDVSDARQMGDGTASQNDKSRVISLMLLFMLVEIAAVECKQLDCPSQNRKSLSRTQVIVIATCSSVIGTFFIIAGAMRIHNCLKRYRANRETEIVVARRTSAFGFGASEIRRDSASSKASRQPSHPASKAGSDTQVDRNGRSQHPNSHNSPQHCSDHNPLLPVHLVGQFSDGRSSDGSLAFIDEESRTRSKVDNNSGSELGSEDDPLLRKSPDSGSSIDIGMEDDDKLNVKDEQMRSSCSSDSLKGRNSKSPTRALTSPDREVVFEPGGDSGSGADLNSTGPDENSAKTCNENKNDNENIINEDNIVVADPLNSQVESTNLNINEDREQNVSKERLNIEESKSGKRTQSERDLTRDNTRNRKMKLSCKQFSVDYFDVDDNGVEILNPIFEESNDTGPLGQLSENHAVTTGLTQSDSSISNNPSYCYGNQTEYDNSNGYGQIGYCCPYSSKTDNDIKLLDNHLIQNSLRNSVLLSAETLRLENGELLCESFDETCLRDKNRKTSLIDNSNKAICQRMYSTDSYFSNPMTRLSPYERLHSASPGDNNEPSTANTDSTISTRKLRIVPLEEYHRHSLKDGDDAV